MDTLRGELNDHGFDWQTGRIIYQPVTDNAYSPGWADGNDLLPAFEIPTDHPILDEPYDGGYGAPRCPRIVAFDTAHIYYPYQYDGASGLTTMKIRPDAYIGSTDPTPYPGG